MKYYIIHEYISVRRNANTQPKMIFRIRVGTSSLCIFYLILLLHFSFTRRQTINWFLYTIFGANTCTANGIFVSLSSICITRWPKKGLEGYLDKKFVSKKKKTGYQKYKNAASAIWKSIRAGNCLISANLITIDKFPQFKVNMH